MERTSWCISIFCWCIWRKECIKILKKRMHQHQHQLLTPILMVISHNICKTKNISTSLEHVMLQHQSIFVRTSTIHPSRFRYAISRYSELYFNIATYTQAQAYHTRTYLPICSDLTHPGIPHWHLKYTDACLETRKQITLPPKSQVTTSGKVNPWFTGNDE